MDIVVTTLRARAFELADSGAYEGWKDLKLALLAEGFDEVRVCAFGLDSFTQKHLAVRCSNAYESSVEGDHRLQEKSGPF